MSNPETDAAQTRFARGSGVIEKPFQPRKVGNIAELRQSLRAYNLRGLEFTLYIILAVCGLLAVADAVSFVGSLWYGAGIHPGVGLVLFAVVSLFQRHLLSFKAVIEELFGKGTKVAKRAGLTVGAVVVLVGSANVGSSALGGLYVLSTKGYNWQSVGVQAVAILSGIVVSNWEIIAVLAWLVLGWVKRNR